MKKTFLRKLKMMTILKKLRKPYLAITMGTLFLFFSCTQNDLLIDENPENFISSEIALKKFEASVIKVEPLIQKFKDEKFYDNKTNYENDPLITEILNELSEPSVELLNDYGFNDADYKEVFGNNDKEKLKNEIASAALMLYRLQTLTANAENNNLFAKTDTPDAVNCFLEATGIAAGIGLVGALTANAGGKSVKKAFKAVLKKVGSRLAGGIGLFLMAAEFTWCMNR